VARSPRPCSSQDHLLETSPRQAASSARRAKVLRALTAIGESLPINEWYRPLKLSDFRSARCRSVLEPRRYVPSRRASVTVCTVIRNRRERAASGKARPTARRSPQQRHQSFRIPVGSRAASGAMRSADRRPIPGSLQRHPSVRSREPDRSWFPPEHPARPSRSPASPSPSSHLLRRSMLR